MKDERNAKAKYFKLGLLLGAAFVVLACLGTYAWFRANQEIYTFTHVQKPSTLAINGAHKTEIEQIKLEDLDLTDTERKKQFVFCIKGTGVSKYDLELAFTTNVPFTYKVYKSSEEETTPLTGSYAVYKEGATTYYYPLSTTPLEGTYINNAAASGVPPLADVSGGTNDRHTFAYDTYDKGNVQKHAEPVYYLFKDNISTNQTGEFWDYYVLELSWDAEVVATYNKETDLVYLLAESTS